VSVTQGAPSPAAQFKVNNSTLIPVNFTFIGTHQLASTNVIRLSGSAAELGDWVSSWHDAIGPATIPAAASGLLTALVAVGTAVQFKNTNSVAAEGLKNRLRRGSNISGWHNPPRLPRC
jgi:hypothetical protein